jgi:hypothetical protein
VCAPWVVSNLFWHSLVIVLLPSIKKIWHAFCVLSKKIIFTHFENLINKHTMGKSTDQLKKTHMRLVLLFCLAYNSSFRTIHAVQEQYRGRHDAIKKRSTKYAGRVVPITRLQNPCHIVRNGLLRHCCYDADPGISGYLCDMLVLGFQGLLCLS